MSNLRVRIGGDGPVVAESDATGWRLIVRGNIYATGVDNGDLHVELRELALRDPDLAHDAFGVVVNCAGAWEDEYTEEHGEDALTFEDWMERIATRFSTMVDVDGELIYGGGIGGPHSDRLWWVETAIFETRRWIDNGVAEARADPIVSRPGEWDFDPGIDQEAIVRRAEQTIAALEAERATILTFQKLMRSQHRSA